MLTSEAAGEYGGTNRSQSTVAAPSSDQNPGAQSACSYIEESSKAADQSRGNENTGFAEDVLTWTPCVMPDSEGGAYSDIRKFREVLGRIESKQGSQEVDCNPLD